MKSGQVILLETQKQQLTFMKTQCSHCMKW